MLRELGQAFGTGLPIDVYVDFDGTIAPDDPTDRLFDRFADPSWRKVDQAWLEGRLSSADAMAHNVSLLRATPEEVVAFLRAIPVDPDFPAFVDLCRRHGARVTVVSDGLDLILRTVLGAAGIELPSRANQLVWRGGDRWEARFPHRRGDCRFRMGNCKCAHRRRPVTALNVMVGDGRSDFCIAERCQLVIAKGSLLRRCRERQLPHVAMSSFREANVGFAQWIMRQRARSTPARTAAPGAEILEAGV